MQKGILNSLPSVPDLKLETSGTVAVLADKMLYGEAGEVLGFFLHLTGDLPPQLPPGPL